jgi:LysR family transcriptional regulator, nod-box dependent transcriptional activator
MDLHGFDLNLLVALDALLSERSVTNAGRRVHLSQSAMSGVLARLRHAFNDELLVPGRGGMTLTPRAEALVEPVAHILRQVQQTLATHVRFDPASSKRSFTIAASDYAVTVLLADFLREVSRQAPNVRVTIAALRDPGELLDDRTIDLVIMPKAFAPSSACAAPLFEDVFTGIVAADHPTVGRALSIEDYQTLGHVAVSFADDRRSSADERLVAEAGLERRIEVVAPSFDALPALVAGTRRMATIQRRLATLLTQVYPIRVVPLPVDLPTIEEVAIWHARHARDDGHGWFRNLLTQIAEVVRGAR